MSFLKKALAKTGSVVSGAAHGAGASGFPFGGTSYEVRNLRNTLLL